MGKSLELDPAYHAYRRDLADTALASKVIASHYAEPLAKTLVTSAPLFADPKDKSSEIRRLAKGETFDMLDCTRGWAWGYAGEERRVGYVRAEAIGAD